MEEYGRKHGLSDMDAALEYLRGKYPEYRCKQVVPFRKYLASQVPEVQRRMDAHKKKERAKEPEVRSRAEEENRLQEIEHAHVIDRNGVVHNIWKE